MRVLFIGAHPDDIELGSGGTLLKHIDKKDEIYYLVLTKGEKGGDKEEREKELLNVIKELGIKNYKLLDYQDTFLNTKFNEIKDEIERIIKDFEPDRIYTHSLNDSHQDHKTIAEVTKIAGRYISQILSYWSPSTYNNFNPEYFIDISKYIDKKIKLLENYKSQKEKDFMKRELIKSLNRYYGYLSNTQYAEGFEIIRFKEIE